MWILAVFVRVGSTVPDLLEENGGIPCSTWETGYLSGLVKSRRTNERGKKEDGSRLILNAKQKHSQR
jgi:hypothetical protein